MLSVLSLYLVNTCLIFSILYMLYRSLMVGRTPSSGLGRGRQRKHGLSPAPVPNPRPLLHLRPPLLLVIPPSSLLIHIPRSLLWYSTLDMWSQLSLHSPSSLLCLHPHLQEMRPAPHLYLVLYLPLPPISLARKVPRPPHPPPHRAPRTSAWSLDMMVNFGK